MKLKITKVKLNSKSLNDYIKSVPTICPECPVKYPSTRWTESGKPYRVGKTLVYYLVDGKCHHCGCIVTPGRLKKLKKEQNKPYTLGPAIDLPKAHGADLEKKIAKILRNVPCCKNKCSIRNT